MTLQKLHSARTGSARPANGADYHIVFKGGLYRVFDKAGRFRVGFATLPAAQAYIEARATVHAGGAVPDGRLAWEVG